MDQTHFFETMLDNFTDGVYILDDKGNYIFVNSAYVEALNMPKSVLLRYNVHDFLETGQIDICISDIVYREKRQVVMFQDVMDTQNYGRQAIRQMVTSTPIFDEKGRINNILAVVRPLDKLNSLYCQASENMTVSAFSGVGAPNPVRGNAIIGESSAFRKVLTTASMVAGVDSPVLISGESGTGKEVIAQLIHDSSPRSAKPLVVINCASLPETLLEAELFGYEKGAFTGAAPGGKAGLFEEAEGGTLFLDEINSMPLNSQGKVLRAIETKTIQRVGGTRLKKVDFRLLSAVNEDLGQLVEEKRFRADLYYRIAVIPIDLPPLRERREDIVPLALHFLKHFCRKYSKEKAFTQQSLNMISRYEWPGNVRELKNFIERSVVMSLGKQIEILDLASFVDSIPMQRQRAASGQSFPGAYAPAAAAPASQAADHALETTNDALATAEPVSKAGNHAQTADNISETDAQYERMIASGVSLEQYLEGCEKDYVEFALRKFRNSYKAASALGTSQSLIMRRKKKYFS